MCGDMLDTPCSGTISATARGSVTAQFPAFVRRLWIATKRADLFLTSAFSGKPALPETARFPVALLLLALSVAVLALFVAKLTHVSVAA